MFICKRRHLNVNATILPTTCTITVLTFSSFSIKIFSIMHIPVIVHPVSWHDQVRFTCTPVWRFPQFPGESPTLWSWPLQSWQWTHSSWIPSFPFFWKSRYWKKLFLFKIFLHYSYLAFYYPTKNRLNSCLYSSFVKP